MAGVVAAVAEDHGHHVDRGAIGHVRGDLELSAIVHRTLAAPGVEHRLDGDLELLVGVHREGPTGVLLHDLEEALADVLEVGGGEPDVRGDVGLVLDQLELLVEELVRDARGPPCRRAG